MEGVLGDGLLGFAPQGTLKMNQWQQCTLRSKGQATTWFVYLCLSLNGRVYLIHNKVNSTDRVLPHRTKVN